MSSKDLIKIWNQVPVDYYQSSVKRNFLQRIWHTQKLAIAIKLISNLDFKNCLDVGSASGFMLHNLSMRFPDKEYFGIDVYEKAIDYAKKIYPKINFRVAPADKLPFKDDQFDLILCYETIEHVEDPKAVLNEMKRVLSKDGHLILAMDSGNWMFRLVWFFWEKSFGRVWQGAHLHPFHHTELEKEIKDVGFKIKKKSFSHLGMEVIFLLYK